MNQSVKTTTLEIAYIEDGPENDRTAVLVHGFPDDATTWHEVSQRLVAAGYRTLAPYVRGYGGTRFLSNETMRSGQIAAFGQDLMDFIEALDLKDITLIGHDWGARATYIASAMMPERIDNHVALAVGYGTNDPTQRLALDQVRQYWYQWFLNTDQGAKELATDRRAFTKKLWEIWSPDWNFTDEDLDTVAASLENPDFVEIAVHSYRHRWANAKSDPAYAELEEKLAAMPKIQVPTTVLMGADDGATLPELSEGKEEFFTGGYRREVLPGVGHFVQRERPDAVVEAAVKVR